MQVPSGSIDFVTIDGTARIQFNCSCMDALPYCQAACCKGRELYNTGLDEDELELFEYQEVDKKFVLKVNQGVCGYLSDDKCTTHEAKPRSCSRWHCSPGGVGDNITEYGNGWVLVPSFMIE